MLDIETGAAGAYARGAAKECCEDPMNANALNRCRRHRNWRVLGVDAVACCVRYRRSFHDQAEVACPEARGGATVDAEGCRRKAELTVGDAGATGPAGRVVRNDKSTPTPLLRSRSAQTGKDGRAGLSVGGLVLQACEKLRPR